jgi:hypothetical protein
VGGVIAVEDGSGSAVSTGEGKVADISVGNAPVGIAWVCGGNWVEPGASSPGVLKMQAGSRRTIKTQKNIMGERILPSGDYDGK